MTNHLGKIGRRSVLAAVLVSTALVIAPAGAVAQGETPGLPWVGTWSSAMQTPTDIFGANWSHDGFSNQTVREVVRISAGGPAVRIRLSNVYGSAPLRVAGATVARAGAGASVQPGTVRALTFHHARSAVVPAGQELASD